MKGKAERVLEIGIGTGPNLRYYGADDGVRVFGVDPNQKMERYAQAAAVAAGLPLSNFEFIQAVCDILISVCLAMPVVKIVDDSKLCTVFMEFEFLVTVPLYNT